MKGNFTKLNFNRMERKQDYEVDNESTVASKQNPEWFLTFKSPFPRAQHPLKLSIALCFDSALILCWRSRWWYFYTVFFFCLLYGWSKCSRLFKMSVTSVHHYSPCNLSMRHLKGRENVSPQRGVIKFVCIPRSEWVLWIHFICRKLNIKC